MRKLSQIDESMTSVIRTSFQLTKANGDIVGYFEENKDKYKSVDDIKRDLKGVAEKAYKKYVTSEDAVRFSEWYPEFEKSFLNDLRNKE